MRYSYIHDNNSRYNVYFFDAGSPNLSNGPQRVNHSQPWSSGWVSQVVWDVYPTRSPFPSHIYPYTHTHPHTSTHPYTPTHPPVTDLFLQRFVEQTGLSLPSYHRLISWTSNQREQHCFGLFVLIEMETLLLSVSKFFLGHYERNKTEVFTTTIVDKGHMSHK